MWDKFWLRTDLDMHTKSTHSSKMLRLRNLFDSKIDLQVHLKETYLSDLSDVSDTLSLEEQSEQHLLGNYLEQLKCELFGKQFISISEIIDYKKTQNLNL